MGALQDYGLPAPWAKPKLSLRDERRRLLNTSSNTATTAPASVQASRSRLGKGSGAVQSLPPRLDLGDIGVDSGLMASVLEAVATGGAEFWAKPHDSFFVESSFGGVQTIKIAAADGVRESSVGDPDDPSDGEELEDPSVPPAVGDTATLSRLRIIGSAISSKKHQPTRRGERPSNARDEGVSERSATSLQKEDEPLDAGGGTAGAKDDRGADGGGAGVSSSGFRQDINVTQEEGGSPVSAAHGTKYRTARNIDADIMATVTAEIRPVAPTLGGGENAADRRLRRSEIDAHKAGGDAGTLDEDDATLVAGPEIDWGLKLCVRDGGPVDRVLLKLREAKAAGISLPALRQALKGCENENETFHDEDATLIAGLGVALRSGEAVCVCGAQDVM